VCAFVNNGNTQFSGKKVVSWRSFVTTGSIKTFSVTFRLLIYCLIGTADDISAENAAPDNVRQWLQLIQDENALSSQDFLSASESEPCADASTASRSTLHTRDDVNSVVTADHSTKDVASEFSDAAAGDHDLAPLSREDILRQFSLARFVSGEHGLGTCC